MEGIAFAFLILSYDPRVQSPTLADLTPAHPLIVDAWRLSEALRKPTYIAADRKDLRRLLRAASDPGPEEARGKARRALYRLGMLPAPHVPAVPATDAGEADATALALLAGSDPSGRLCWWWPRANLRGLLLAGVPLETLRSAMAEARAAGRNPWREVRRLWPAEEAPPSWGR